MFFFYFDKSNSSLHEPAKNDEDVSILVGENGSGKSLFLNDIQKHHLAAGKKVIMIANTIFDKFQLYPGRRKILRNSTGKTLPTTAMKSVIRTILSGTEESKYAIRSALEYIGFDFCFDIKLVGLAEYEKRGQLEEHLYYEKGFFGMLSELLLLYEGAVKDSDNYKRIDLRDDLYFLEFEFNLLWFFVYKDRLKKAGILTDVEICLVKKGERLPVLGASSGELTLLTSFIFISAHIDKQTVILIDEPENSLHPKWQIEYIKNLISLFYFYQPKIVIATHSPLIINGGKGNLKELSIYKGNRNGFFLVGNERKNVEEIYEEYFDVTTPENRFLSEFIMERLNLLAEKKINRADFENIVDRLLEKSYDDTQKEALKGILELSKKID
jgi:predicted ATPase